MRLVKGKVHLYLIVVTLIYAATFSLAKLVMPVFIGPYGFIVLRVFAAALLLTLTKSWFTKDKIDLKAEWKYLLVCAIFGVAANMLMFFKGLSITQEINAAVMMLFTPIFVFIFSYILKTEKLYWWNFLGIIIAAMGAAMFLGGANFRFQSQTVIGDIFVMLNAISYAFYLVYVKRLLQKYHPIAITQWCFIIGLFIVLPFGLTDLKQANFAGMSPNVWFAVLFVLIFATFITYVLNALAIKEGGAGIVGSYIYLQPVMAAIIAELLGRDHITIKKIVFTSIVLLGVYLVSIKKDKENAKNTA